MYLLQTNMVIYITHFIPRKKLKTDYYHQLHSPVDVGALTNSTEYQSPTNSVEYRLCKEVPTLIKK